MFTLILIDPGPALTMNGKKMNKLIKFLKKYNNWQWYGNDKETGNIVNKLVSKGICKKRKQTLENGYIYRQVILIKN